MCVAELLISTVHRINARAEVKVTKELIKATQRRNYRPRAKTTSKKVRMMILTSSQSDQFSM